MWHLYYWSFLGRVGSRDINIKLYIFVFLMTLLHVPWLLLSLNKTKFRMKKCGGGRAPPAQLGSPPITFSAASQLRHRQPVWANLSDTLQNPPRGTRWDYGVKLREESSEGTCQRPGKTPPLRHCCLLVVHTFCPPVEQKPCISPMFDGRRSPGVHRI